MSTMYRLLVPLYFQSTYRGGACLQAVVFWIFPKSFVWARILKITSGLRQLTTYISASQLGQITGGAHLINEFIALRLRGPYLLLLEGENLNFFSSICRTELNAGAKMYGDGS